jgi:hypothetical protein
MHHQEACDGHRRIGHVLTREIVGFGTQVDEVSAIERIHAQTFRPRLSDLSGQMPISAPENGEQAADQPNPHPTRAPWGAGQAIGQHGVPDAITCALPPRPTLLRPTDFVKRLAYNVVACGSPVLSFQ